MKPNQSVRSFAVAALVAAAGSTEAFGQPAHWVAPGASAAWEDPLNWSGGLLPGSAGGPTAASIDRAALAPYEAVLNSSRILTSLDIVGPFATLRHTSGTLWAQQINIDAGAYQLIGGTVLNTAINGSNGGRMVVGAASGSFPASVFAGATVNAPTTVLGGEIQLDGTTSFLGGVTFLNGGLMTYSGNGIVRGNLTLDPGANDEARVRVTSAVGGSLTVNPGVTISGSTSLQTEGAITNNGTLVAVDTGVGSLSAATFGINSGFGQVLNNGLLHADGAFYNIVGASFSQSASGTLRVENNSRATIYTGAGQGATTLFIGGHIDITGGSTLSISGRTNSAFLSNVNLSPDSILYLAGRMDNAGRTIEISPLAGRIDGSGGLINGGTINIHAGALAPANVLLENVTVNAGELVLDSSMQLQGTSVINSPVLRIGVGAPPSAARGSLFLYPGVNFALEERDAILDYGELSGSDDWTMHIGAGSRLVGRNGRFRSLISNDGLVLDDTGTGTLILGLPNAVGNSTNRGVIRAAVDGASIVASNFINEPGGLIEAGPGSQMWLLNRFVSTGQLRSDGGLMILSAPMTRAAAGAIEQVNGGGVVIADRFDLQGTTLAFDGSVPVWRLNGTITNGAVALPAGVPMILRPIVGNGDGLANLQRSSGGLQNTPLLGNLVVEGGTLSLDASTVSGVVQLGLPDGSGGVARIFGGTPNAQGRLPMDYRITSNRFASTYFSAPNVANQPAVELATTSSISGMGTVTLPGTTAAPSINRGAITADMAGETLFVGTDGTASFTNFGAVIARNGARLAIGPVLNGAGGSITVDPGSEAWITMGGTNAGLISINGGHARLLGTFTTSAIGAVTRNAAAPGRLTIGGTVNNASATLRTSDYGGSLELTGGTISGGTVNISPGFPLIIANLTGAGINQYGNGTITGATVNGQVTLEGILTLAGGASLIGLQQVTSPGGAINLPTGTLNNFNYTVVPIAGVTPQSRSVFLTGSSTTLGATSIISGAGGRLTGGVLTLQGTLRANLPPSGTVSGTLLAQFSRLQNNGTIEATGGGTLRIDYSPQNPSNYILGNLSGGTLTGGTWRAGADSTLDLAGRAITTAAATIELHGSNALFPALSALQANTGLLSVLNGASLTLPGNLVNTGTLTVDDAQVALAGAFSLGTGTPRGTLRVIDIVPGDATHIAANTAVLSGTLFAQVDPVWTPTIGDRFLILTAPGGLTGQFTSFSFSGLPAGWSLTPAYQGTRLELVAVPAPGGASLLAGVILGLNRKRWRS